jgi:hypothetical protein
MIYPASRVLLDGAAAIAHDQCAKIQRYYGGYSADNGRSALKCVIRNLEGEKFFVSLGDVNGISVGERHENIPPPDGNIFAQLQGKSVTMVTPRTAFSRERC